MDKVYPNVNKYLADQVWAIRPETLDIMEEILAMRASGVMFSQDEIQARIGAGRDTTPTMKGAIAVIPLYGVIDQKVSMMIQISGGTSINSFMESFRNAMNDSAVSAIILDVDSPGGSVCGIPEAANEIYAARGKKPILAVANPRIASAAYWIASAADEIYCMQSGEVGSIGVVSVHTDLSEQNKMYGRKPTYITYGEYKAETNSDTPLSEEARGYVQAQVNQMGDMFTRFVAKGRGVSVENVRSTFGKGRMLLAKDALSAKMIDGIGTLDQTIARLARGRSNNALGQQTGQLGTGQTLAITAATANTEDDMQDCGCTCPSGCECGGANNTCCGNESCDCCSGMDAKASAPSQTEKDLSILTEREASKQVLVGLDATLTRWGGLVDRTLARGKKPGAALSKANAEQLTQLCQGISDAKAKAEEIMLRAGVTTDAPAQIDAPDASESSPGDTTTVEAAEEQTPLLALEVERNRFLNFAKH